MWGCGCALWEEQCQQRVDILAQRKQRGDLELMPLEVSPRALKFEYTLL